MRNNSAGPQSIFITYYSLFIIYYLFKVSLFHSIAGRPRTSSISWPSNDWQEDRFNSKFVEGFWSRCLCSCQGRYGAFALTIHYSTYSQAFRWTSGLPMGSPRIYLSKHYPSNFFCMNHAPPLCYSFCLTPVLASPPLLIGPNRAGRNIPYTFQASWGGGGCPMIAGAFLSRERNPMTNRSDSPPGPGPSWLQLSRLAAIKVCPCQSRVSFHLEWHRLTPRHCTA